MDLRGYRCLSTVAIRVVLFSVPSFFPAFLRGAEGPDLSPVPADEPVDDGFLWTPLPPALKGRVWYSMAPLPNDSAIACFGGHGGNDWRGTDTCDIYDPVARVWNPGPELPLGAGTRMGGIAIALPDAKVLYCGGIRSNWAFGRIFDDYLTDCYIFDPLAGAWTRTGDLPSESRFLNTERSAVVLHDGRVLVCGGVTLHEDMLGPIASSAIFDPATGIWTATPPMSFRRLHFGSPVLLPSGRVLVCGGVVAAPYAPVNIHGHTDTAEIYDPLANTWTLTDPLPLLPDETSSSGAPIDPTLGSRRAFHSTIALPDGRVLVVAGTGAFPGFRCRRSCLLFDETEQPGEKWSSAADSLFAHGAAWARWNDALPGSRVFVFGGVDELIHNTASAEMYDPATDRWTRIADLPSGNQSIASNTTSQLMFNLFEGDMYATVLTSGNIAVAYGHNNTATGHPLSTSSANDAVAILTPTPAGR